MTTKVFPAIRQKMHFADRVSVQVDNASPHTGNSTIASLNRTGGKVNGKGPIITVIQQPAQSPDTNVNDLAVYRSLESQVRKNQRGESVMDKERLVSSVTAAWRNCSPDILEKSFTMKTKVLDSIIEHEGGNDFDLPHE